MVFDIHKSYAMRAATSKMEKNQIVFKTTKQIRMNERSGHKRIKLDTGH